MKEVFTFVAFFVFCPPIGTAQIAISPRVGIEIDSVEREYFGLFPAIEGYISGRLSLGENNQTLLTISSKNHRDTALILGSSLVERLAEYIDNFESVRVSKQQVNWESLNGLAAEPSSLRSLMTDGVTVSIETLHAKTQHGKLLYVSDSSLVLWQIEGPYHWKAVEILSETIGFGEIDNITVENTGHTASSLGWGTLVGLAPGAFFGAVAAESSGLGQGLAILAAVASPVAGAMIGGIVGAIGDIDVSYEIGGNMVVAKKLVESIKSEAIFPNFPPPEISKIVAHERQSEAKQQLLEPRAPVSSLTRSYSIFGAIGAFEMYVLGLQYQVNDRYAVGVFVNRTIAKESNGIGAKGSYWFRETGNWYTLYANVLALDISYLLGEDIKYGYRGLSTGSFLKATVGHDGIKGSGFGVWWMLGLAYNTATEIFNDFGQPNVVHRLEPSLVPILQVGLHFDIVNRK